MASLGAVEGGKQGVGEPPAPAREVQILSGHRDRSAGPSGAHVEPAGPLRREGVLHFEDDPLFVPVEDVLHEGADEDARGGPALESGAPSLHVLRRSGRAVDGQVEGDGVLVFAPMGEDQGAGQGGLARVPRPLGRHPLGVAGAHVEAQGSGALGRGFAELDDESLRIAARVPEGQEVGPGGAVPALQLGKACQGALQVPGRDGGDVGQAGEARMAAGQVEASHVVPPFRLRDVAVEGEEPLCAPHDVLVAAHAVAERALHPVHEPLQARLVPPLLPLPIHQVEGEGGGQPQHEYQDGRPPGPGMTGRGAQGIRRHRKGVSLPW